MNGVQYSAARVSAVLRTGALRNKNHDPAFLGRGSNLNDLMPPRGPLWNRQAGVELSALTDVVAAAMARPVPVKPGFLSQRPGWAPPLVLAVLREATEPMTVMEIVRAAKDWHGAVIGKETVRTILQRSTFARSGLVIRRQAGRWSSYELNRALDDDLSGEQAIAQS